MTREEMLARLTDRPCNVCKFHTENGCAKWSCVFEEEPDDEMTNEEMLDKILRHFFPHALFIREINEASHTKKIIFSDEWLKMPYRGGK